jgi:hypothetical protein
VTDTWRQMSAIGTKRTWASALQMSAFGGKPDIGKLPLTCSHQWHELRVEKILVNTERMGVLATESEWDFDVCAIRLLS